GLKLRHPARIDRSSQLLPDLEHERLVRRRFLQLRPLRPQPGQCGSAARPDPQGVHPAKNPSGLHPMIRMSARDLTFASAETPTPTLNRPARRRALKTALRSSARRLSHAYRNALWRGVESVSQPAQPTRSQPLSFSCSINVGSQAVVQMRQTRLANIIGQAL